MGMEVAGATMDGSSTPGSPQTGPGSDSAAPTAAELRNLPPDFWIYNYKIVPCENTQPHDWEDCLYSHKGEKAKRRDPCLYQALQCPEARTKRICPRGESCPCTHSLFEYWLHPDKFRTCMCEFGNDCKRRVCFFAHNPDELRKPPNGDVVVDALAPSNADGVVNGNGVAAKGANGATFRSSDSDDLSGSGSMHDQQQQYGGGRAHGHTRSLSGRLHGVGSGAMMGAGGMLGGHGLNPNTSYNPGSPMPPGLNGSLHHLGGMPPSVLEEAPASLQQSLVGSSYLAAQNAAQQADLLWDSGSGVGGMALAEESYGPIGGYGDTWSAMDLAGGLRDNGGGNGRSAQGTHHLSSSSHASTTSMSGLGLMCSPGQEAATADAWGSFPAGSALGGSSSVTARRMASLGLPPRTASVPGVYHRSAGNGGGGGGGVAGVAGLSRTSSGAMGGGAAADAGLMDAQAQLLQLQELHRLRSHSFDVPASTGSMSQLQHIQAQLQQQQQQQQQRQMAHEPVAAQLAALQQQQMRAHSFDTPYTLRSMQAQAQAAPVRQPTATVQSLAADIMSLDTADRRALLQHLLQMQP